MTAHSANAANMILHPVSPQLRVVARPDPPPLPDDLEKLVQDSWDAETKRRSGTLFNGRLFSVEDLGPDMIAGSFVEYRRFVAQLRLPDLFDRLRIRPLAVSGVIESPDGLIFGRRNPDLMTDGGKWELVPSGGVDPDTCLRNGHVDYMEQFYTELAEEVGIVRSQVYDSVPLTLVGDFATNVFDLAIAALTDLPTERILAAFGESPREHSQLKLVRLVRFSRFLAEAGSDIASVTTALVRRYQESQKLDTDGQTAI